MAMSQQQIMDLVTSFGPVGLAALAGNNSGKTDPQARARNDLANLLEVKQNAAGKGAEASQNLFNNQFNTRQTMGGNAVADAGAPNDLMMQSQKARLMGAIGPQLAGMFGQNVSLPQGSFDIYNRMGSDQNLSERLNQLGEGMSMRSPMSTPLNLTTGAGQGASGLNQMLQQFGNTRKNEFQNAESDLNKSTMNAVAGYQGAAQDYEKGIQGLNASEQKEGTPWWKKALGIGAIAAMPFTGGLSGALAGATGLGTAASAGLVGAGLGAAGAVGGGGNPLMGALLGGATNAAVGPGGKWGQKINVNDPVKALENASRPGANMPVPQTGSRNQINNGLVAGGPGNTPNITPGTSALQQWLNLRNYGQR